ncbi:MAG TPA: hypothetical protein VJU59_50970 [Paraburkholderia sp.]|uniref:hypothetical protein n=1 Tax=Paraburkholderia sp. TaxID=1926495 RepID=UPI002B4A1601|nr:hypothetical protein [Paraburkholderia sp.]HKR47905.1 hypothetical protein [Paraburkholderia sp.]
MANFATPTVLTEYRGHRLIASAAPAHASLFVATLRVERPDHPARCFDDLDHFYDAPQAVAYATDWGRVWVDCNM